MAFNPPEVTKENIDRLRLTIDDIDHLMNVIPSYETELGMCQRDLACILKNIELRSITKARVKSRFHTMGYGVTSTDYHPDKEEGA